MKSIIFAGLSASSGLNVVSRAATTASSVPCQNARDATLAGTSTARYLLSSAQQGIFANDPNTIANITAAYGLLTSANVNLAGLAMSAALGSMPTSSDVQNLTSTVKSTVLAVQGAQNSAQVAMNQTNIQGVTMNLAFPLITINGPEVIVQQVTSLGTSTENVLDQISLQLQSVLQSAFFLQSCTAQSNMNTTGPQPPFSNSTQPANTNSGNSTLPASGNGGNSNANNGTAPINGTAPLLGSSATSVAGNANVGSSPTSVASLLSPATQASSPTSAVLASAAASAAATSAGSAAATSAGSAPSLLVGGSSPTSAAAASGNAAAASSFPTSVAALSGGSAPTSVAGAAATSVAGAAATSVAGAAATAAVSSSPSASPVAAIGLSEIVKDAVEKWDEFIAPWAKAHGIPVPRARMVRR